MHDSSRYSDEAILKGKRLIKLIVFQVLRTFANGPKCAFRPFTSIGKISLKSPVVINIQSRASLTVETKGLLFLWLVPLNNKSNVTCKQISSL